MGAIGCVGCPPTLGRFRIRGRGPRQNSDWGLSAIPLNGREILDGRPCLRCLKRRGIRAKPKGCS